ncbi:MAG: Mth938-like domain-containing protein [Xanthomonadaceae bacterium]|nr:Mth938-like domain-containing protein [Xanthomonadaceae bacterium]MDE1963559.1 Mth938-like domain-containing protein [Xanthomonadaceae bacterium]
MDLSLDLTGGFLFVRRTAPDRITVADRDLLASFVLAPDRLVEAWPVADARILAPSHAEVLLALRPELVILGSGARQVFPPAAFLAAFLGKGIGIEVMDNAAAARTYDLLAGEGRRVVAGFILAGND